MDRLASFQPSAEPGRATRQRSQARFVEGYSLPNPGGPCSSSSSSFPGPEDAVSRGINGRVHLGRGSPLVMASSLPLLDQAQEIGFPSGRLTPVSCISYHQDSGIIGPGTAASLWSSPRGVVRFLHTEPPDSSHRTIRHCGAHRRAGRGALQRRDRRQGVRVGVPHTRAD